MAISNADEEIIISETITAEFEFKKLMWNDLNEAYTYLGSYYLIGGEARFYIDNDTFTLVAKSKNKDKLKKACQIHFEETVTCELFDKFIFTGKIYRRL